MREKRIHRFHVGIAGDIHRLTQERGRDALIRKEGEPASKRRSMIRRKRKSACDIDLTPRRHERYPICNGWTERMATQLKIDQRLLSTIFAVFGLLVVSAAGLIHMPGASAQPGVTTETPFIPSFWDPRARIEPVEISAARTLRVLTSDDFPPLHFAGPGAVPTGFSVEIAREVCERLRVTCTVQTRRFEDLAQALDGGQGDVVAAALPITAALQNRFAVTHPYFRSPARFVQRTDDEAVEISPASLAGKRVGVVAGTAHEAFLATFFPDLQPTRAPNTFVAQGELRRGETDLLFGDGLTLALWIGGRASEDCCAFLGGPYLDEHFFGEGIGFVMRSEDGELKRAFDYALHRLWEEGKYSEIYLSFFPVSPF
jgi:polar amino acid transport system substrate-binding protein